MSERQAQHLSVTDHVVAVHDMTYDPPAGIAELDVTDPGWIWVTLDGCAHRCHGARDTFRLTPSETVTVTDPATATGKGDVMTWKVPATVADDNDYQPHALAALAGVGRLA